MLQRLGGIGHLARRGDEVFFFSPAWASSPVARTRIATASVTSEKKIPPSRCAAPTRAAANSGTVLAARLMASRGLDTWEELTVPILLSIINMNLRDKYASLTELCNAEDVSEEGIADKLKVAGYKYVTEINQFKADT